MTPARWLVIAVLAGPLAVNPFGASPGIAEAKNALFMHLALGLAVWTVTNLWLRAFVGAAWLSFLVNGMHGFIFMGLLAVVCWALIYQAATTLDDAGWRRIRLAILAAATFQVAYMGAQYLYLDPIFKPIDATRWQNPGLPLNPLGWFSNSSDLALFFGLALPAVGAIHPVLAGLLAAAVLALRSTAGLACVVIWGLWMAGRAGWKWVTGAGIGLLVLAGAYLIWVDPPTHEWRPIVWRSALSVIETRPIVGYGMNALDNTVVISSPVGRWNFLQNEWLQLALETGGLGLGVVVAYTGRLLWRMASAWERLGELVPAILILLAVSLFSIPFRIGPVALLAALYLGRAERLLRS